MKQLSEPGHGKKVRVERILDKLPEVFGTRETEKFVNHSAQWSSRAVVAGYIVRLQRGVYWNRYRYPDLSLPFIACQVKAAPCYISCEWALHSHGVLLQRPFVCTVITLSTAVGAERRIEIMGESIEFSHIAEKLFWGYEPVDGYFLAGPEKAYLDTLYYGRDPEKWGELDIDMFEPHRLLKMAKKFPQRIQEKIVMVLHSN